MTHSATVMADSLYEAAALGLQQFKAAELLPCLPGEGTRLEITVAQPSITHSLPVTKLRNWLSSGGGRSPAEMVRKEKLRGIVPWLVDL